jgi:FkbM family methyltransferase
MLIPFTDLQRKYKITPNGVLHVGANVGEEIPEYHKIGVRDMIFIEANPNIFQVLQKKCSRFPEIVCYNNCISDVDGETVDFHIANNAGQSSSFLELGTHKEMHPDVKYIRHLQMKTVRLDTLLKGIDSKFDFLNMDLQGAEGHALRGMGDILHQFRYLYLECNKTEVYKGCMQLPEMDDYLKAYGFYRVETFWPGNCTWGDCFYIRK